MSIIPPVAAVVFFLAGLPVAFLLDKAIFALSAYKPEEGEGAGPDHGGTTKRRALPWQTGVWPGRIRLGFAATAPIFMAAAGARFEAISAAAVSLFLVAMLLCTATDLIRFRVPNAVTYPATVAVLLAALLLPGGHPIPALLTGLAASGFFLLMAIVTRGGLGLGDVKLALLIGAALGFPAGYEALVLGVLAGGMTIAALFATGVVSRRQSIPYAPFLALSAAVVVLLQGAAFAPI